MGAEDDASVRQGLDVGCTLSPYVRPLLQGGRLFLDNAIVGRTEALDSVQEALVRALWKPVDQERLEAVVEQYGLEPVTEALVQLLSSGILFQSESDSEAWCEEQLAVSCPSVPFVDQIELTNACPMRCGFCPRGVTGRLKRPTGFMDRGLYLRLLDQLPASQRGYRPLELHHLGESLLHPLVVQFVAEATQRGFPTEMSVNPALLTPTLARGLVEAGLRRLVISLDGMDAETLGALRGPASRFELAQAHLEALLELVGGLSRPPSVVIQMLDLYRNRDQRQAFRERWGQTGLKTVQAYVKDLDGPDPELGVPSPRPTRYLCTYPWRSVVVLWDGRVVPCCRDADGDAVLGDLKSQSLREIWQGEAVLELRRAHRLKTLPLGHPCAGCGWRRDNFAAALAERHPDKAQDNPLVW